MQIAEQTEGRQMCLETEKAPAVRLYFKLGHSEHMYHNNSLNSGTIITTTTEASQYYPSYHTSSFRTPQPLGALSHPKARDHQ